MYASHFTPQQLVGDQNARAQLLSQLQADPSGYFKNASWGGNKGDLLTVGGQLDPAFNGISQFDVIRGAGAGGLGHVWQPIDPNPHPASPAFLIQNPGLANAISPTPMVNPSLGNPDDARARLNSLLAALQASAQVR
jgi:hypothetical protein